MSRDGTGTYSTPATMAVANTTASSTTVNSIIDDMSQALTDSINKDGTKSFAASQSMGNNRLTSLAAGTAASDAARLDQVQKNTADRATTVGGTVDAITLAFTPTITTYTTGMTIRWVSAGANTVAAPTVNVDTIGVKTLKKNPAASALVAGDLGASGTVIVAEYNGTDFIVLNPGSLARTDASNTFTGAQTINGGNFVVNSNTDYGPQTQLLHAGATAGSAPYYILNRARGTYASPTIVSSGDQVGTLLFQAYDGSTYRGVASIEAKVDGTTGATDTPGRLVLSTTADGAAGALTERVRITNAGGVSFGSSGTAYGTSGQLLQSNGDAPPSWGGATTLLGTLTMTVDASKSLTSQTLTNYKFLKFVFDGVSTNNTGPISIGAAAVTGTNASANIWYGFVNLDLGTGLQVANLAIGYGVGESSRITDSGYSTATTTITVSTSVGVFDAGTITVYGVS